MNKWTVPKLTAAVLVAGITAGGLASGASAQQGVEVEILSNEIAVYGDGVANAEAMKVRIADPDGDLVLDAQSDGDPVAWSPSVGDPDGLYRYEVVVITRDPAAAGASGGEEFNNEPGVGLVRQSGSFEIRGGAIVEPRERDSSLWDGALRLAGAVLDAIGAALIPSAQAENLNASSANPTVFYNDTDFPLASEWRTRASQDGILSLFEIIDDLSSNIVIQLESSALNALSMRVDPNGDLRLADDSVFIDRSSDWVGIGTTIPLSPLHVSGFDAAIRMTSAFGEWKLDGGSFGLVIRDLANDRHPFSIEDGAGNNTLVVRANQKVGIGVAEPASTLEVSRNDGSTQVLVEETSVDTANRRLMQLTNNGRPQVRLSNAASGVNWVTGMGTDDAYIIRRGANEYRFTKGGRVRWFVGADPTPRFDYSNNGNLKIAGTLTENSDVHTKRDVEPVDGRALLDRVAALPVSTWAYKEDEDGARHIGPMAQDFHAAFGLGADDTSLSPRDVAGVALAAVQELLRRKDAEIAALTARLAAVEARLAALD